MREVASTTVPTRPRPAPTHDGELLRLCCKRCGSRLVPVTGKWGRDRDKGTRAFKCPRLSACGYGGVVEDADVARELLRERA